MARFLRCVRGVFGVVPFSESLLLSSREVFLRRHLSVPARGVTLPSGSLSSFLDPSPSLGRSRIARGCWPRRSLSPCSGAGCGKSWLCPSRLPTLSGCLPAREDVSAPPTSLRAFRSASASSPPRLTLVQRSGSAFLAVSGVPEGPSFGGRWLVMARFGCLSAQPRPCAFRSVWVCSLRLRSCAAKLLRFF